MTNVEYVNTHELRNGDLVQHYGITFRLRDRQSRKTGLAAAGTPEAEYFGDTVWFKTDVVEIGEQAKVIGFSGKDWTIQGNKLATWKRVS